MQGVRSAEVGCSSCRDAAAALTHRHTSSTSLVPAFLCSPALRQISVSVTSQAFAQKAQPARHRLIYALLRDELARDGGIHALQLQTRTPEEEERLRSRQAEEQR